MILYAYDREVADYVGQANGKPFKIVDATIGVVSGGRLIGGFVFTGHNGDGIELSLAGRGCITREAWRAVTRYVFDQLGCARLQVHTRRSNKAIKTTAPKGGFRFEGVARRFYGDEDGLCYSLTRDDLQAFRQRWGL